MSIPLSYPIAKEILTDVEKERIVCTYLNATDTNAIEWEKAAADFGSASIESYKKGVQNTIKKIKKAMDGGVQPAEGTPAKATNKGGRKRKEKAASAVVEDEGEEASAAVEEEAPKKKKAKAAPKKSKAALKAEALAAALAEADEDDVVKSEGDAEE